MKTLTKKQRGEIYLKVAEVLQDNHYHLCGQLAKHIHKDGWSAFEMNTLVVCESFPEFELFKPFDNPFSCWFSSRDEGANERIICLLKNQY